MAHETFCVVRNNSAARRNAEWTRVRYTCAQHIGKTQRWDNPRMQSYQLGQAGNLLLAKNFPLDFGGRIGHQQQANT